jgi:hypothetical protein
LVMGYSDILFMFCFLHSMGYRSEWSLWVVILLHDNQHNLE